MKLQLPAERSRDRNRDRAIWCLGIDVEERARLYRRRMDMLPNNNETKQPVTDAAWRTTRAMAVP